jgi:hypothetical protein
LSTIIAQGTLSFGKIIVYHLATPPWATFQNNVAMTTVPDSKSRNIPEVVFVRGWAVGVLGIWKGWDSWVKGGANGVSLQAT